MRWLAFLVTVLGVVAVAGLPAGAQGDGSEQVDLTGETLVVATKPLEPFVFIDSEETDGSGLRGYSIDVWVELEDRLGFETEWLIEESVGDILDSTQSGDADVAIAGISMTAERETFVDFTHPYYDSGLQVATRPGSSGAISSIVGLATSRPVLLLFGGLVVLTLVVAHLIWLSERRSNDEFPMGYREGVSEALWWSTVSVITGGEAVKNIRRPMSRLLAVAWMVIGLFLIAFVTAQAASQLTLNQLQSDITGLEDLPGRSVVTVEGTVAETFLREVNTPTDTVTDLEVALEAVANGRYDAVVFDAPVLAYRANTDYSGRLDLVGSTFAPDPYGIALVSGSPIREAINAELLAMSRDGTLETLNEKWLGVSR